MASVQYQKVLFKPDFGLQVQEMSEIQDRQNCNNRLMGDSLFRQGSSIINGNLRIESDLFIHVVSANSILINGVVLSNRNILIGRAFGLTGFNHSIQIIHQQLHSDGVNVILFYRTLSGALNTQQLSVPTARYATEDQSIQFIPQSIGVVPELDRTTSDSIVAVSEAGTFYAVGYFIEEEEQRLTLNLNGETVADRQYGFRLIQNTITASSDSNLLDPDNSLAEGADRLDVSLSFIVRTTELDTEFIPLGSITNQDVEIADTISTSRNLLNTQLAQRTFDTVGNFTLSQFTGSLIQSIEEEHLMTGIINPGEAYVNGNYINKTTPTVITIDKARTTQEESEFIDYEVSFFNFDVGTQTNPLLNFNENEIISLRDDSDVVVGTARLVEVILDNGDSKIAFQRSSTHTSTILNSVRSILGQTSSAIVTVDLIGSNADYTLTNQNTKILEIGKSIQDIRSVSYRSHRYENLSKDGNTYSVSPEFYGDLISSIQFTEIFTIDGGTTTRVPKANYTDNGDGTLTFTTGIPTIGVTVRGFINYANLYTTDQYKTKTITNGSLIDFPVSGSVDVDIALVHADIIEVSRIEVFNNQGGQRNVVLTHTPETPLTNFIIDDGQRDLWYQNGSVRFNKNGVDFTDHFIDITYTYYTHGNTDNPFFTFESYTGGPFERDNDTAVETYTGIYTYRDELDQTTYTLRDAIDFRPLFLDINSTNIQRSPIAESGCQISTTINAYEDQIVSIVLTDRGVFEVRYGDTLSDITILETEMETFRLMVPAFTFSVSDIDVTQAILNNRGYTYADIRSLEDRIAALEALHP